MQKNLLILLPWAGSQAEHARHKLPIATIMRMLMIRQAPEDTSSIADFHSSLLLPFDVVEGSRLHSKFFSLVCGRPRTGILLGMLYSSMCFQPWAAAKWSVGSSTSLGDASRCRDVRACSFSSPAPSAATSASCLQLSKLRYQSQVFKEKIQENAYIHRSDYVLRKDKKTTKREKTTG